MTTLLQARGKVSILDFGVPLTFDKNISMVGLIALLVLTILVKLPNIFTQQFKQSGLAFSGVEILTGSFRLTSGAGGNVIKEITARPLTS